MRKWRDFIMTINPKPYETEKRSCTMTVERETHARVGLDQQMHGKFECDQTCDYTLQTPKLVYGNMCKLDCLLSSPVPPQHLIYSGMFAPRIHISNSKSQASLVPPTQNHGSIGTIDTFFFQNKYPSNQLYKKGHNNYNIQSFPPQPVL